MWLVQVGVKIAVPLQIGSQVHRAKGYDVRLREEEVARGYFPSLLEHTCRVS